MKKNLSFRLTAAVALAGASFASVQAAEAAKPTIVLVHGAWADGSSWSKVIPLLQAKGYTVLAVQNPLTSLAADVAATKQVLQSATAPVVLVGHGWAGTVITEAGNDPKVAALVYVAAFANDDGQSAGELVNACMRRRRRSAPSATTAMASSIRRNRASSRTSLRTFRAPRRRRWR